MPRPTKRVAARYVEVAPAVPLPATSAQTYTYQVPADGRRTILPYQQVRVPFGRRQVAGVVLGMHADRVPYPTKPVTRLLDRYLRPEQIDFARWIATTMQGGLGYTLRLFIPAGSPAVPAKRKKPGSKAAAGKPVLRQVMRTLSRRPVAVIDADRTARHSLLADVAQQVTVQGKQVLVLVPEKQLLAPLVQRLEASTAGAVASITADTPASAVRSLAAGLAAGRPLLVVGTQKGLFLPYRNLGLVIIDEEFYPTNKLWDQYPRLHTVLGAEQLARLHSASLLYSTSVASLRLQHAIDADHVAAIKHEPVVPRTKVVAPTFPDRQQRHLLPAELTSALKRWLVKKERVVILHNRTGSWQVMACRDCHAAVRCPDCQIALRVHGTRAKQALVCQQCGYRAPAPAHCPACGKKNLYVFGPGTERIEASLRPLVPAGARLDLMTAATAEAERPDGAKGQLIVGTSALFRHVLPGSVDHVIYLFPEQSLRYPDYRSEEKSWYVLARLQQLLRTPAAPVWLVTRQPRVTQLLEAAPAAWYQQQLAERRRLSYPPYATMVRLTVAAVTAAEATKRALIIRGQIADRAQQQGAAGVLLRGPFESYVRRRRGKTEAHLLLLGELETLTSLYDGVAATVDVLPERVL